MSKYPLPETSFPGYQVESSEISDLDALEKVWLELQLAADCSFFLSWGWIGTWLSSIAKDLSPVLVTVKFDGVPVALGVFISTELTRHHLLRVRVMYLNEAPFAGNNMVIEYNGLLIARGHEEAVYPLVLEYLLEKYTQIDEFYFNAMSSVTDLERSARESSEPVKYICQQASTTRSIDLRVIGQTVDDFLSTISKNRRLQIKRSIRLYEKSGHLNIEQAETVEQARQYFDELKVLHTMRWQRSGKAGSFANDRWERFHRKLIADCFDSGNIQLLKIANDVDVIGYLYNFIWNKRIYVLQTGFKMQVDKRLMPGYVCHVLAIAYNVKKGMGVYDLMHGDDLYKKLLCNRSQNMYWSVVQRRRISFMLEDFVRYLIRKLRNH